jgi:hypothetical protein
MVGFKPKLTLPLIKRQPASTSFIDGGTATFIVEAEVSSGSLSYQWQLDSGSGFSNIGGATSASYTTGALTVAAGNGYSYRCNVTDSNGTVTSSTATVLVHATNAASAGQFSELRFKEGWFQK